VAARVAGGVVDHVDEIMAVDFDVEPIDVSFVSKVLPLPSSRGRSH
jgi:hypothetical protein